MQEAALLVDRSDIQEEIVRLETHVQHFLGLLDQAGEVGKKLDFLLQEMNREANTAMKTSASGEALKITEAGHSHEGRNRKIARAGAKPGMTSTDKPVVYIISAPSGSGKSTLTNELLKLVPNLDFSISYTTRAVRGSD